MLPVKTGHMRAVIAIALILCCAASVLANHRAKRIVGGHESKPPPPDDPVVFSRIFNRDARVEGFRNPVTSIYSFLGLYYAEPPVGQLRYARPVYKRLAGDQNATVHGPPCIQPDPYRPNRIVGDENCLLLNIYTPQMPDESTGLPVLFWIHPGGFRYGSASQYDATPIAQQGVIVVAAQYRLGSLGVIGDGSKEFDGNLAIFDMAAALRWVSDYISFFGGDPKQIKAIGHGSGAASAMYLSMSRTARSAGDVSGVVAMSGTALSQYATDKEPVQSMQEIASINDCPTTNETVIVQCLRNKPAAEIIRKDSQVQTERLAGRAMVKALSAHTGFDPHAEGEDDGRALPGLIIGTPESQLMSAKFEPIPLLTGVAKHETVHALSIEAINATFGSAQQLLSSLTDAVKDLSGFLNVDRVTGEIAKAVLPGLPSSLTPSLNDVLRVPETLDLSDMLFKVVSATTDVLFNLPAVLTSQTWSKIAPAFMYSFEYNGTKSRGVNFLRGLPIVSQDTGEDNGFAAHGDELGYLFDANDLHGNPLPDTRLESEDDLKVRENIVGMLVKFAHFTGDANETKSGVFDGLFRGVSGKGTPFIKLSTTLGVGDDFHFCDLSVLGAPLAAMASTTCKGFGSVLSPVTDVLGGVGGRLSSSINSTGLIAEEDLPDINKLFRSTFRSFG